jgi:hypothetical protein
MERGWAAIFLEGIETEKKRQGEDHEFGVEQDEDAGVVEAPFAAQAAGGFYHSPAGDGDNENLPGRGAEMAGIWKAFEAQAGCESDEGEQDAAEKGSGARAKDGGTGKHGSFTLDSLAHRYASRAVVIMGLIRDGV